MLALTVAVETIERFVPAEAGTTNHFIAFLPNFAMRRVALLIETSRSYGRDLLRGVKRYSDEQGSWSLFVEMRDLESKPPVWLKNWDGSGILTRSGSTEIAKAVRMAGVPAVELRSTRRGSTFPFVGVDNSAVGVMVANHFAERGFRHFGVYSLGTESFFQHRRDSFVAELKRQGHDCHEFRQSGLSEKPGQWETQQKRLMNWVEGLPKPTGIMACTDSLGCWLLDACWRSGLRVPDDIAVVGVENDSTLATMSTPPLSSVQLDGLQIGYTAAKMLDLMMQGKRPPKNPTLIEPHGIVSRLSSDIIAVDDPLVAQAIGWIRDHACSGITVADVLSVVPISRSSLERNFRQLLGRSPNQEINRVRVERVSQLLRETDSNLDQIARRTGFSTPQYLLHVFRKATGKTPGEYRREHEPSG